MVDEKEVKEEKPEAPAEPVPDKKEAPVEPVPEKTEAEPEKKEDAPAPEAKPEGEEKPEAPAEEKRPERPARRPPSDDGPPRRFQRGGGRGRRRRTEETIPEPAPPPPEPEKYDFDFEFPPLFGKWDWSEVEIHDISLTSYINIEPVIVPHVGGKYANKSFGNRRVNIVERLINNMMRTEHTTGNKSKSYKVVSGAFDIIAKRTKKNPIQVFIEALEGAAPKEEITRLKYGGISVPKAVDIAASRRLDVALRNICKGAHQASRKNKKKLKACLADEILKAAAGDLQSFAIAKKDEIERIAASAR